MKTKSITFIAVALLIFGCGSKSDQSLDSVSGVYVREHSFPVINQETGAQIGMRTLRDTIFIMSVESGYQVSNRKWKLDDYEKDGWRNMEHDENRPIETFTAEFDPAQNTLTSSDQIFTLTLRGGALTIGFRRK